MAGFREPLTKAFFLGMLAVFQSQIHTWECLGNAAFLCCVMSVLWSWSPSEEADTVVGNAVTDLGCISHQCR